ncbi:hyccin-like [Trichomycterus rosablanca]|uniref:hyccin-like n=1 Tax=Trichomycterus rosablanca TaxID=2290929 RepID=UPI002F353B33
MKNDFCCSSFLTDAVDLGSPEELMEISEVDEGIYTQPATKGGSPPTIVISCTNITPSTGKTASKGLRRLTGSKSSKDREKEKEKDAETLSKHSCNRAMSENLDLLSLKRLTLTSSQSVPKGGALSLSRTASAAFSRSFEQVSNALGVSNRAPSPVPGRSPKGNRHSACSLQEEAYMDHTSPAKISLQLSSDA